MVGAKVPVWFGLDHPGLLFGSVAFHAEKLVKVFPIPFEVDHKEPEVQYLNGGILCIWQWKAILKFFPCAGNPKKETCSVNMFKVQCFQIGLELGTHDSPDHWRSRGWWPQLPVISHWSQSRHRHTLTHGMDEPCMVDPSFSNIFNVEIRQNTKRWQVHMSLCWTRHMEEGTVVIRNRLQVLFVSRGLKSGCQWKVIQLARRAFPSSPGIMGNQLVLGDKSKGTQN